MSFTSVTNICKLLNSILLVFLKSLNPEIMLVDGRDVHARLTCCRKVSIAQVTNLDFCVYMITIHCRRISDVWRVCVLSRGCGCKRSLLSSLIVVVHLTRPPVSPTALYYGCSKQWDSPSAAGARLPALHSRVRHQDHQTHPGSLCPVFVFSFNVVVGDTVFTGS